MPRHRRDIPPAEVTRLAQLRSNATRAVAKADTVRLNGLLALSPDPGEDLLGAIAWAGIVVGPADPLTVGLVERALGERWEWREIATALGADPGDEAAVANVAQAHRRRRAR